MKKNSFKGRRCEAGFSLIELMIALGVTLIIMGLAGSLLASSFNVREREDRRSVALAQVERALNIMSNEISCSGFRLPENLAYESDGVELAVSENGIISGDSGRSSIRIVTNLDDTGGEHAALDAVTGAANENEDVRFSLYEDAEAGMAYLVRHANNKANNKTRVLAGPLDSLKIRYYDERVTYSTSDESCDVTNVRGTSGAAESEVSPGSARYVVIAVCVDLPAVGTPGADNYQPAARTQLVSDVALRNADLLKY